MTGFRADGLEIYGLSAMGVSMLRQGIEEHTDILTLSSVNVHYTSTVSELGNEPRY